MSLDLKNRLKNTNMVVQGDDCPYLSFKDWSELPLIANFSTRYGGVSRNECESMNLSFSRENNRENVLENYRRITKSMGIDMESLICTNQTHTVNVKYVNSKDLIHSNIESSSMTDVDGLITDDSSLTLVALFADCAPIYVYDDKNHTIAMLHAGWRGTVGNIISVALNKISDSRKNIKVAVGPCISVKNYEVEYDVAKEFINRYEKKDIEKILIRKSDSKYMLDIKMANKINSLYMGIDEKNIIDSNICTYEFNKDFFSHRYTNGKRGNMASFMKLK